ncbi:MAG: FHA domain-containing protein [Cyanobacteria bacterium P01_D01_bin.156]
MDLTSILIVEDSNGRREILLDSSTYLLGRDTACDIHLDSQFVCRHHAILVQLPRDDETYFYRIVDGNLRGKSGANGMLINGQKRQAHNLKNEDEIVFGPQARAIYYQLGQRATPTVLLDKIGTEGSSTHVPFTPTLRIKAISDNA